MGVDNITLSGSLDVDSSVDPVTISSVGPVGPVTVAGIPDPIQIKVVDPLPTIHLNVDPLTINPVELNLRLTEIPNTRVHLPADFCVGLSMMGMELMTVRLCGEAQAITEPYKPNPCEVCGPIDVNVKPATAPDSVLVMRE